MSEVSFGSIEGLVFSKRQIQEDDRGSFSRIWEFDLLKGSIQEQNYATCISSNVHAGTIRGLHFQIEPFEEHKWITCLDGSIFDVVLDLRRKSKTFGSWAQIELHAHDATILEIPPGIAHGFQTLSPRTRILYSILGPYSILHRKTINPFDRTLGITWPLKTSKISKVDQNAPTLNEYLEEVR